VGERPFSALIRSIETVQRGTTPMNSCPGRDSIQGLLDECLEASEFEEIVIHIEVCASCQELLEALTRGHGWKSTMPDCSVAGELELERAPVERDPALGSTDELTGELLPAGSIRTLTLSGPAIGLLRSDPGRTRNEWPAVPGYEIEGRLGEGGMGVVYKARQVGLNRLVALKMIRGGSQARPDQLIRFSIEAEAVARLRHQNIIQIYDIGEVDGSPYVSLELLEGGSLADQLRGTPQPGRPAAELLETLVLAIVAAHEAGIIHRDLKPTNVLFTADGVLRVTDFGLAKRLESDDMHTETGQVMGSPSYRAPEQARGHTRDIGPATDVYALGAILYEMLTGRPPFKGETAIETIRQVIDDEPVPPSRLVPRLPRDLETMSLKCLNKDAHKRYASAQALADDLRRYINGEPIKARPTPFWERGAKWTRRRPVTALSLFLGTAAVLCAIVALAVHDRYAAGRDRFNRETNNNQIFDAQRKEESDPEGALSSLLVVRSRIKEQPTEQRDLDLRARVLIEQIETRLVEQSLRAKDRKRLEEFFDGRQLAFTHDTGFTGPVLSGSRAATRRAARAALDVFGTGAKPDSWVLEALPASFSGEEKERIREGCYELLVILAEAVDQPAQSLRFLDEAAALRAPDKTYHLRRASYLSMAGDAAGAEREQRLADATPVSTPADYFLAGREQFKRRDYASANRHFDYTRLRQPEHFWARCLSALCALQMKQHPLAKEMLTVCIEREKANAWLHVWRGLASAQLAAKAVDAERDHQFQEALADYDRVLELLSQQPDKLLRWVLLVNRGTLFVQHENWEKAAADFQGAIGLDANRPQAFEGMAIVYLRQHKPDEAIEQFSRAISLQPESAALYRARGDVELARKEPTAEQRAKALADLDQAIRLEDPVNPVLALDHTRRARLLRDDHRLPEALSACEAALDIDHAYKEAHLFRIEVLLDLKRYEEVTRSCDALLARDKTSAALYELRGLARASLRDFAGAIEDHTQAIELEPGRALGFIRRGGLYLVSDAPKLALHDFREAVRLDSSNGDALSGRAAALVRLGQYREAVADAEKGLGLGAFTAQRLYSAARIYARAAAVAGASTRTKGRESLILVEQYQDRGTALLREAMKRLPAGERTKFWREIVQSEPDPAMNVLRRRLRASDFDSQASVNPGGRREEP
jgi:serine/threonine protein kinase/tetratricopeptide (TPR) repeat protein